VTPRYRFAPSPTGYFHVGGARTALYNWILAQRSGGIFVLRIEDTDESRNEPQWTQGIIDALAWIGISGDDPHFEGPYFQSANAAAHVAAARRLFESGMAYYCDLTGEQVQERAKTLGVPGYDGYSRDRGLGPGPGRVLRFRVPEGTVVVNDAVRGEVSFEHTAIEDFVLLRGNGTPVFLLANVVDDISQGITHVVRAEEHLPNTPKQQLLWTALGSEPPAWAHVPVLVNEARKKLSKRRDKVAIEQYRDEGVLPEAMVNYPPAFFDIKKLHAFNGEYIRALSAEQFVAACEPWLRAPLAPWPDNAFDRVRFLAIAPHVQTRVALLSEVPAMVDFLFLDVPVMDEAAFDKVFAVEWAGPTLRDIRERIAAAEWTADALKKVVEDVGAHYDVKLGKLQAPLRVAVTGRTVGPPLFESMEILGAPTVLARIDTAIARAAAR
jgi:glutamyl-tRNA synthetase